LPPPLCHDFYARHISMPSRQLFISLASLAITPLPPIDYCAALSDFRHALLFCYTRPAGQDYADAIMIIKEKKRCREAGVEVQCRVV